MIKVSGNPKIMYLIVAFVSLAIVSIPLLTTGKLYARYLQLQARGKGYRHNDIAEADLKLYQAITLSEQGFAETIFQTLSEACAANQVLIKTVDLVKSNEIENTMVQSQQITVQGGFIPILKSLVASQDKLKTVKIVSIRYTSVVNNNKDVLLEAQVAFQQVKAEKSIVHSP